MNCTSKNWTQFLEVQFFMSKYLKEAKEKLLALKKELSAFKFAKELKIPESTVKGCILHSNQGW